LPGVIESLPGFQAALPGLLQQLKGIVYGQMCDKSYTIKSGDTCWQISNNIGQSLQSFLSLNPNLNCANLQIGQIVCI
jgi:hypothetical protein